MSPVQHLLAARATPDTTLRRLYVLRNIAIAGQALTVAWVHYGLAMRLPLAAIASVIGALALFNVLARWRLTRAFPVTDIEIFLQLTVDVAALTALLYLSGGASNPFVSLYLLPLIIVAITLPLIYTGLMTTLTITAYTWLMFWAVPLPTHHGAASDFDLHLLGMWFNFMLSAALVVVFITRMAVELRERDRQLAAAREEHLRSERIVALGTLAAGAAHELGTPLSTMAVISKELQRECAHLPKVTAELECLRDQVNICKQSLTRLVEASGHERAEAAKAISVEGFLNELLEQWRIMRPAVPVNTDWAGQRPAPMIAAGQMLAQTLTNLFNNAADASPDGVEVKSRWSDTEWCIEIRDRGPGVTPEVAPRAGVAFITTKAPGAGLGVGLVLANATVERLGGRIRLFNRAGGGALTQVSLPLAALAC
ncbi:MAG: ATP-binding protein [Gammaproteobacteria bacterium]